MDSPERRGTNGLALAAFVLGIVSVYRGGFLGFLGSPGTDWWLFAIGLDPAAAGLACAYLARQQIQLIGGERRDQSFVIAGAILAVTGTLTSTLAYVRLEQLDVLGF
ncbi:MAG: hypothetical protein ACRDJI_01440 [Actinomycetota bacterium]